jgi:uncharacterized membrane protein
MDTMRYLLIFIVFLAGWYIINRFIFPKLGIST